MVQRRIMGFKAMTQTIGEFIKEHIQAISIGGITLTSIIGFNQAIGHDKIESAAHQNPMGLVGTIHHPSFGDPGHTQYFPKWTFQKFKAGLPLTGKFVGIGAGLIVGGLALAAAIEKISSIEIDVSPDKQKPVASNIPNSAFSAQFSNRNKKAPKYQLNKDAEFQQSRLNELQSTDNRTSIFNIFR